MACLLSASWRNPGHPGRLSSVPAAGLPGQFHLAQEKPNTKRRLQKKLERPEDRKCQNPGCPLSLALAGLRMPVGKE